MLFTPNERRLLLLLAILLLSGFMITALRTAGLLPARAGRAGAPGGTILFPEGVPGEESLTDSAMTLFSGGGGAAVPHGSLLVRTVPSSPFAGGYLDVNRADSLDLVHLPGIGPVMAGRILELRRSQGPFRTLGELLAVKGIGRKRLEKLSEFLTAGQDCTSHDPEARLPALHDRKPAAGR